VPPNRPLEEYDEFRPRQDWEGPPRGVVGQPVAVKAVLARSDELAISLVGIAAFPTGVKFNLLGLRRPQPAPADWRSTKELADPWNRKKDEDGFRFGVVFADGRKATSFDPGREAGSTPTGPVLRPSSGTHSYEKWNYGYWLWPLPSPGDLTFVCEWRSIGIPESRTIVDATAIVEASSHAIRLWPESSS
jgi:hypothetical protein